MTTHLTQKKCTACIGGIPPLEGEALHGLFRQLSGWTLIEAHHLEKTYPFKNFKDALVFTNKVGELAETEGHHPDIEFGWGYATITLSTHAVGGLSENDFILAAKIDRTTLQ